MAFPPQYSPGKVRLDFIRRAFGRASRAVPWNSEASIRKDRFSMERLEQHAESLAAAQEVAAGSHGTG
jgi:cyclic beta-1,2-glucan synthetase